MVRVVLRWTVGAAILAWAVLVVVAQLSGHPMPWWLGMLPWLVIVVLVVARVVREVSRRGGRTSVRRALTPAGRGLDEVQGIHLGRPPGLVVSYGDDEPAETELVVPRADPQDAGRWTIGAAGDVTVEGDEPGGQR
jgi:hypothetical protein